MGQLIEGPPETGGSSHGRATGLAEEPANDAMIVGIRDQHLPWPALDNVGRR